MGNIFDQFDEPSQQGTIDWSTMPSGGTYSSANYKQPNMFDQFDEQPALQMQTPQYDDRDSGGGLNNYLMGQARGGKPKQQKQFNLNAEWSSIRQDPLRGLGDVGLGIAKGVNNVASTIDLFNPLAYTDFGKSGRNMLNQQARTFEEAATNKIPFQAGKVVGEIVPTLGIPGGVAGGLAKKMATGALSGGLQAGLMDAGEQQADTGNIDWGRAAAQGAVGTMFGGMGGALTHGIQAVGGKLKTAIDEAQSGPLLTLQQLLSKNAIDPEALDEAEQAALRMMQHGEEGLDNAAPAVVPQPEQAPIPQDLLHMLTPQQPQHVPAENVSLEDLLRQLDPNFARAAKPRVQAKLVPAQPMQEANDFFKTMPESPQVPAQSPQDILSALAPPPVAQKAEQGFFGQYKNIRLGHPGIGKGKQVTVKYADQLSKDVHSFYSDWKNNRLVNPDAYANNILKQLGLPETGTSGLFSISKRFKEHITNSAKLAEDGEQLPIESIRDLVAGEAKAAPVSVPNVTNGEKRFMLDRNAAGNTIHGQERGTTGLDLEKIINEKPGHITPEEVAALHNLAASKINWATAQAAADQFAGKLAARYGNGAIAGMLKALGPHMEKHTHKVLGDAMSKLRNDMSDIAGPLAERGNTAVTLSPEAIKGLKPNVPEVQNGLAANEPILKQLFEALDAAKTHHEITGQDMLDTLEAGFNRLQKTDPHAKFAFNVKRDGLSALVEFKQPKQERAFLPEMLAKEIANDLKNMKAANKLDWESNDLGKKGFAQFDLSTWYKKSRSEEFYRRMAAEHPEFGFGPDDWEKLEQYAIKNLEDYKQAAKTLVEKHNDAGTGEYYVERAGKIAKATKEDLKEQELKPAMQVAGAAAGGAALNENDEDTPETKQLKAVAKVVLGLGTAGALMKLNPSLRKKLIEGPALQAMKVLGDTLDHVGWVDNQLGTDMGKKLMNATRHYQQSQSGVQYKSEIMKASAMGELKKKTVNADEALKGKAGSVFEKLSKPEREGIVTAYLVEKSIAKEVAGWAKKVQAHQELAQGLAPDAAIKGKPGTSFEHMSRVDRTRAIRAFEASDKKPIDPTSFRFIKSLDEHFNKPATDDFLAAMTGGAYDYLFQANPGFHGLNLLDSAIAGGSRIGPYKMTRAWNMLGNDKHIQELFEHANLSGSMRGDRLAAEEMTAKNLKSKVSDWDFKSDRFNANRVHLASLLQSHDELVGKGIKVSEKYYLDAVMNNKPTAEITQAHIDDAWTSALEHGLRTLAVDPLKFNRNVITKLPGAKYYAAFINQPARIARLANEYVANGQYDKLANMILLTGVVGGKAAIPITVRSLWEFADPETALATEQVLDQYNLSNLVGRDISRKVNWDSFAIGAVPSFLGQAQQHPGVKTLLDWLTLETPIAIAKDASQGKLASAGGKLFSSAAMAGLAGKLPMAGNIGRGINAINQSTGEERNVWGYHPQARQVREGKETIKYSDDEMQRLAPLLNYFLPGTDSTAGAIQNRLHEQWVRKNSLPAMTRKMFGQD